MIVLVVQVPIPFCVIDSVEVSIQLLLYADTCEIEMRKLVVETFKLCYDYKCG